MAFTRSGVARYAIPILAILVLTLLLTVTLFRLADIQRAMRNNVSANMVWVISQAHIESLMLRDAVQQRLIDPEIPSDDLTLRYQILLSRIGVLNDGPQKRALEAIGMGSLLADQAQAIVNLSDQIDDAHAPPANYQNLLATLHAFNASLLKASGKAMVAQWEEAGTRIDTYRNAVLTIFFLMIGVLVSGGITSVQLLLALKRTRDNERVRQREIELKKELENERKISELYRSFGSMVSHQFRTPLAIIDATMQRLMRAGARMDVSDVSRHAAKARDATQRLSYLIENILQADRFMEQLKVTMRPCNLGELSRQAVAEQKSLSPARELQLRVEAPETTVVQCDPVLTSQIIGNFLSNAIKYSESDTPVEVHVYREAGWVCCSVRDYGRGISAHDLPHVFKRYFRAGTAIDVVGTGIGLHIAAQLAALQDGEVHAVSEPGAGATFVLRLPNPTQGKSG